MDCARMGAAGCAVVLCWGVLFGPGATAADGQVAPGAAPCSAATATSTPTTQTAWPADGAEGGSGVAVAISPYAWLTGYDGDLVSRGIETKVAASFADVLERSDSVLGLMGAVDVELGRVVLNFNGAFAKAELEGGRGRARSGPLGGGVTVSAETQTTLKNLWAEAAAGYRLIDQRFGDRGEHRWTLDALGGLRVTAMDVRIDATAEANVTLPGGEVLTAGIARELNSNTEWLEPLVGLRAAVDLNGSLVLSVRGDIGGFDVDDSQFAWQAIGLAGYRWRLDGWTFGVFAGYRALGQRYESASLTWDVVTHGPVAGCNVLLRF
ncbi:MAG: hypothetical protein LW650_00975 [Planctomycetaceae bacterium]|nr:hypothetical protein [Planctomycetaceae bacterium]